MTDIHSHILFDIDDGSGSIDESLSLLKKLKSIGFDNIIVTPHYIEGSEYSSDNRTKLKKFKMLKKTIIENELDINIYLGNEIFIHKDIINSIRNKKIYSLNGTRFLLIEMPFHNQLLNLEDILYDIKYHGFIPIIAHPERYSYFQEDYSLIDELREDGILFQCNYSSILGYHGKGAMKTIKYMLKKHYVDFLGTDIHHINKTFVIDNFKKIEKKIIRACGKEYYKQIKENCDELVIDIE